jgi:hypothetical protein
MWAGEDVLEVAPTGGDRRRAGRTPEEDEEEGKAMTSTHTGWLLFAAALGMMASLIAPEVSALSSWATVLSPAFIGKALAHFGAVVGAFVAGKMIPTEK